jgi:hypothetical protein
MLKETERKKENNLYIIYQIVYAVLNLSEPIGAETFETSQHRGIYYLPEQKKCGFRRPEMRF